MKKGFLLAPNPETLWGTLYIQRQMHLHTFSKEPYIAPLRDTSTIMFLLFEFSSDIQITLHT
jgi:hypothetical protein